MARPSDGFTRTGSPPTARPSWRSGSIPLFLGRHASALLNELAHYLLNEATAPLLAGQTMQYDRSVIQFIEGRPERDAGYDPEHDLDCIRLVLVDPPDTSCACERCARERQRGSLISH